MTRKTHLAAARGHGRRAVKELRHAAADSALHWILSHKGRVAQFRRAVKGTRAAKAVDTLLQQIREDATRIRSKGTGSRRRAATRRSAARRRAAARRRTARAARYTPRPFPLF
jgi:hypothetical protein